MGEVVQDTAGEPQTGQAGPLRLVSSPSAPTGQGAARRAQSTRARPLQLLRHQRPLSQYAAARRSHEAGLVQMAVPSQPAHALDVGEVWRLAPAVPSSPPTDYGPHLGRVATSHINGRAGWWKSPCPDLARGRGGKPPGLLYNAFLPPHRPSLFRCGARCPVLRRSLQPFGIVNALFSLRHRPCPLELPGSHTLAQDLYKRQGTSFLLSMPFNFCYSARMYSILMRYFRYT